MNELNTFYLSKPKMNTGYIFFDDYNKVKKMTDMLDNRHISYYKILNIIDGNKYVGFKVWNINRKLLDFTICLKEVLE